ncbi:MAG: hypothetical protein WAT66_12825 [Actinomycetota bacterium]
MALRCGRTCARWIAVLVGVGALVGAAINIHKIYATYSELRGLRWPLAVSAAVLWFGLAVLCLAGARWNCGVLLVAIIVATVEVLGDYDNESWHVPLLSIAVIALVVASRQSGDRVRELPPARIALLVVSLTLGLLAVAQMQVPDDTMNWERVRTVTGTIEVRPFVAPPPCAPLSPKTELLLDQGCDDVIPAERGRLIIGYAAAAMVVGAAAVAGVSKKPV